jgi:hypothetical protein
LLDVEAKVAQLVEHSTENAGVVGSIPSLGTNHHPRYASGQARSGLGRFCCVVFPTLTAKLTARVDDTLRILSFLPVSDAAFISC